LTIRACSLLTFAAGGCTRRLLHHDALVFPPLTGSHPEKPCFAKMSPRRINNL
jgi:hypothetical protein